MGLARPQPPMIDGLDRPDQSEVSLVRLVRFVGQVRPAGGEAFEEGLDDVEEAGGVG